MKTHVGKYLYNFLLWELLLVGLSAVFGGYALAATDWIKLPHSWLAGSPFDSYFWPGVILALIVGGTHLWAALLLFKKYQFAYEAAAVAGFGLLIWIFGELYIIRQSSSLQILYFGAGTVTISILLVLLKYYPKVYNK